MSRWLGHLGAIIALFLCLSAAGCSAAVDADGKVVTNRVWFDQMGGAHCPTCDPNVKLRVGPNDPESLVKPHANVCAQDAKHPVVWAAEDVPCWKCSGSGLCPDCRGSGTSIAGKACGGCIEVDDDNHAVGTGRCVQCKGKGTIRYGATGNFGS